MGDVKRVELDGDDGENFVVGTSVHTDGGAMDRRHFDDGAESLLVNKMLQSKVQG